MIEISYNGHYESIIALNMALKGNYDKELTAKDSERNITKNLVNVCTIDKILSKDDEPLDFDGTVCSGLLLTTNGFVLTAYHHVKDVEEDWRKIKKEHPIPEDDAQDWVNMMRDRYCIIDQQGNRYAIDNSFWSSNQQKDIALIKAVIPKKPEPIRFKIKDDPLKLGDEIKLFGLRESQLYNQYGRVISESFDAPINLLQPNKEVSVKEDTFLTDAYGVPGFSGGVFTDLNGRFAGMSNYISKAAPGKAVRDNSERFLELVKPDEPGSNFHMGYVGGAKIQNIINLVEDSAYSLSKMILKKDNPFYGKSK